MTSSPSPATSVRVAFIGLGVMGYPMAGHLARAGHRVCVFNRSPAKAQNWVREFGGTAAPSAADAAAGADAVFSCVGNDDDLRSVTTGPGGALAALRPGAVFVDHTTASARVARELATEFSAVGVHFIDAPVSGGEAGARNGTLTVMCGGDAQALEVVRPLLACYARAVSRIGASGSGQLAKMVNQLCIAGIVQGLAEGIHFGERAGLDMPKVLEVIGKGAAQSWQMDNRGTSMLEGRFDFGFAVEWMRKDLGLCLEEARRNGASLPVAALVDQFYAELQAMGAGRHDTSSLVARLRAAARLPRS